MLSIFQIGAQCRNYQDAYICRERMNEGRIDYGKHIVLGKGKERKATKGKITTIHITIS